jgi:hypothetical protein
VCAQEPVERGRRHGLQVEIHAVVVQAAGNPAAMPAIAAATMTSQQVRPARAAAPSMPPPSTDCRAEANSSALASAISSFMSWLSWSPSCTVSSRAVLSWARCCTCSLTVPPDGSARTGFWRVMTTTAPTTS